MKKIQITLLLLAVLLGCNPSDNTNIPESKIVTEFSGKFNNDTIYFGSIRSIESDNNSIYLTDFTLNNVFVLDNNLNFKYRLGLGGRGPSELNGASSLAISNDSLLVYSAYDRKFNLYYNKSYNNSYYLNKEVSYDLDLRFVFTGSNIYMSDISKKNTVSILNIRDDKSIFDEIVRYESGDAYTANMSRCHLIKYKNYLVLVLDNQPTIHFYNIMTNKISHTYTYEHVPEVSDRIKFIKQKFKGTNAYAEIVQDISVYDDLLYILIHTNELDNDFKWDCNTVLCLDISNTNCHIKNIYKFKTYGLSTIEVNNSSLFTFDEISGNFYKFKLTN